MQAEMRGYLAGVATPKLSPREIDRSGLAVRRLSDQDLPVPIPVQGERCSLR